MFRDEIEKKNRSIKKIIKKITIFKELTLAWNSMKRNGQ
jgi:hypothetical protein